MEKGLLKKTGKTLAEWIAIAKLANLEKHGQIVNYLKSEYVMTHGYANFVTHNTRASDAASHDPDQLITSNTQARNP